MESLAPSRVDPETAALAVLGGASIVAGGLVAAVNSASPFEHGSWLASYLVLVDGVAQVVLGLGRLPLFATRPSLNARRAQVALWNVGNVAVAVGVLGAAPSVVLAGSAALLVALGSFASSVGRGCAGQRGWVAAYHATIVALAVSVGVGCGLAGALPF